MATSAITPIGYTYGPDNLDKPERNRVIAYVQPSIFVTGGEDVQQLTDRLGCDLQDAVTESGMRWYELFQPVQQ